MQPNPFDFDAYEDRPPAEKGDGFFRCPFCGTHAPPSVRSKMSVAGLACFWVFFVLGLVTLCVLLPLCLIGLFMREEYRICSRCGVKLG
jgi:hypothetical protein